MMVSFLLFVQNQFDFVAINITFITMKVNGALQKTRENKK